MAITDGNSVLILGAGVSAPFSVPLGGTMIKEILKQLQNERRKLGFSSEKGPIRNTFTIGDRFYDEAAAHELPIHLSVCSSPNNKFDASWDPQKVERDLRELFELQTRLQNQTSESIDDFIVQNPSIARVTKVAVASIIFLRCYQADRSQSIAKSLEARTTHALFDDDETSQKFGERSWIHHLINIARNAFYDSSPEAHERIRIVTFNYDCILERVLEKQFQNTEHKYGHYSEYIDIAHVHGKCGEIVDHIADPFSTILEWANNIHVVREQSVSAEVELAREQAKAWIDNARYIHCAGFAFASANMDLLGFGDRTKRLRVNYCNYDRSVGVKMNAERYQKGDCQFKENCNDDSRPLSVSDWFYTGYAGDIP